jgi:hypothetical protein
MSMQTTKSVNSFSILLSTPCLYSVSTRFQREPSCFWTAMNGTQRSRRYVRNAMRCHQDLMDNGFAQWPWWSALRAWSCCAHKRKESFVEMENLGFVQRNICLGIQSTELPQDSRRFLVRQDVGASKGAISCICARGKVKSFCHSGNVYPNKANIDLKLPHCFSQPQETPQWWGASLLRRSLSPFGHHHLPQVVRMPGILSQASDFFGPRWAAYILNFTTGCMMSCYLVQGLFGLGKGTALLSGTIRIFCVLACSWNSQEIVKQINV